MALKSLIVCLLHTANFSLMKDQNEIKSFADKYTQYSQRNFPPLSRIKPCAEAGNYCIELSARYCSRIAICPRNPKYFKLTVSLIFVDK